MYRRFRLFLLMFSIGLFLILPRGDDFTYATTPSLHSFATDRELLQQPTAIDQSHTQVWTTWQSKQFALAEEPQFLWIGAVGGVVHWNKSAKTYYRYTALDGLPHQNVYAVAIDAAGNRWFGGDGGLSRLDVNNGWTHFTTANSGLYSNQVDGIAVGVDNTLWVSHGLPTGRVSQRDPGGSWRWYPNRAVAVALDYARIRQTQTANRLWAVDSDEVWIGYLVYNGNAWIDHTPSQVNAEPQQVVVSSPSVVWTLGANRFGRSEVQAWNGRTWSELGFPENFSGEWTALAVGSDQTLWVGGAGRAFTTNKDFAIYAVAGQAPDLQSWRILNKPGPISAVLPTVSGLWAVGNGWLLQPDGAITDFQDVPTYPEVTDALVDAQDMLWVHSLRRSSSSEGVLQSLQDNGTPVLEDDAWRTEREVAVDSVFERAPGGDWWVAAKAFSPIVLPLTPLPPLPTPVPPTPISAVQSTPVPPPVRRHQGAWIEYPLPNPPGPTVAITDIFVQDDRHIWFAYIGASFGQQPGVLALDDGGTPTDLGDDHWTTYPGAVAGFDGAVTVDTQGQLWFGNSSGLYRYAGGQWQVHSQSAVCDLTSADQGVLFAHLYSCNQLSRSVLVVWADGTSEVFSVESLVERHLDLVRSAAHRNYLWTVAPDQAVWYTGIVYSGDLPPNSRLYRRDNAGLTAYVLPFKAESVRSLEVDANNHVWLVADAALHRMTPRPHLVEINTTFLPLVRR